MEFIESTCTDPSWNLALEQYVFDSLDKNKSYFMLWQNDNTIVIGKNQNTVLEINQDYVKKHGIHVVRRLSGGGAVYHDLGNLNFTFIVDADQMQKINFHVFCQPIIDTLASYGITATLSGRNDITIDGRKFSGNSQYIKNHRVMHHGTLMFSSDLTVVQNALHVSQGKLASKGVGSVSSRVTNIHPYMPRNVTLNDFKKRLLNQISKAEPLYNYELTASDFMQIQTIKQERYDTWDWNYGKSPTFTTRCQKRFENCGSVEILLTIQENAIFSINIYGDFFGNSDISELNDLLTGCPLDLTELQKRLSSCQLEQYIHNLSMDDFIQLLLYSNSRKH